MSFPKLQVIKTVDEFRQLADIIAKQDNPIAYDVETTGTGKDAKIIGLSVCFDLDTAYYVVLSYWSLEKQELLDLDTKKYVVDFVKQLIGKPLVMHNAVFDCAQTQNNYSIELMPYVFVDTIILAHILDENRSVGLKDLGVSIFGEDANKEQILMKESVHKNGGSLTKDKYELYKADADLLGEYGAKDALLTLKLFYHFIPELYEQELDKFFFEESMPLLRGPTYDLNTIGLKIDIEGLTKLKGTLEAECLEATAYIHEQISSYIKDKYPGTGKTNKFNIKASKQLSWLLFDKLQNNFILLTKEGRNLCKALNLKLPYANKDKRIFISEVKRRKGTIYEQAKFNSKTKKMARPKKVGDYWNYLACGKDTLSKFSEKYKWCAKLLEFAKAQKILNTYVEGIQERMRYGVIQPSFLQFVVPSGRYASRDPNFQNLPRKDKRVKNVIVARPGKVFVGADQEQLEPRIFASYSKDVRLLDCFVKGDDFYSVIGVETFDKPGISIKKDEPGSFSVLYPDLRHISKEIGLSATYGTTAPKMAPKLDKSIEETQEIIDNYFEKFPSVKDFMLSCHKDAKSRGYVVSLFGRKRRIPLAKDIDKIYGKNKSHEELPYEARNLLNLAVNYPIQGTGASIMNRSAIRCYEICRQLEKTDPLWKEVRIVLQVHDELVLEGPEELQNDMIDVLQDCMENTVTLPGVKLVAKPKAAKNLADLK